MHLERLNDFCPWNAAFCAEQLYDEPMTRQPVTSSNLRSVGYDRHTRTLEIEFLNSGLYQYFDVPPEVFDGLMAAPSHGAYFEQQVRKAGFKFLKVG